METFPRSCGSLTMVSQRQSRKELGHRGERAQERLSLAAANQSLGLPRSKASGLSQGVPIPVHWHTCKDDT